MKSDSEYKRTLYEKYDKRMLERKMIRKSAWISSVSAAACLLLVFVFLASPLAELFHPDNPQNLPTQITISAKDTVLRTYTDEETVSGVCEMLDKLSLSTDYGTILDDEVLYTVTKRYSDGTEEILYHVESAGEVGIADSSSAGPSMLDILNQYP